MAWENTAPWPGIHPNGPPIPPLCAVEHIDPQHVPEVNVAQQSEPGCFCVVAPELPKHTVGA